MRRLGQFTLLAMLGIASSSLFAQPPVWRLDMTVLKDGRVVTAPQIVVNEGQPGELMWQDSKASGPEMKLTATATSDLARDGKGLVADLAMRLYEFVDGKAVLRMAPSLVVKPGVEASVRLGPDPPADGKSGWEIRVVADRFASTAEAGASATRSARP